MENDFIKNERTSVRVIQPVEVVSQRYISAEPIRRISQYPQITKLEPLYLQPETRQTTRIVKQPGSFFDFDSNQLNGYDRGRISKEITTVVDDGVRRVSQTRILN